MRTKSRPAESLDTRQEELTSLIDLLRGDEANGTPAISRDDFEGLVAAAQDVTDRETRAQLRQLVERRLTELDTARQRLRQGQYGYCQECGTKIPAKRLEALPQATRCVPCQRDHEQGYVRARAA